MNKLDELLTSGATQLEIAAALPDRTWEAIRKKIVKLRGPGFDVPETGQLENGETIADYLERNPEAAETMPPLISENCSRQIRCYRECHRSSGYAIPRFNVVALLVHSGDLLSSLSSQLG